MKSHLQKITDKARQIRRNGEKWTNAVKRASKMIPSLSPSKKKRSSGKVGTKKKSNSRQTGHSNLAMDKRIHAKAPGKRIVKTSKGSHTYYERRKNRSDKPGKLTGGNNSSTYRYNVMQRITSNVRLLNEAESRLNNLKRLLLAVPKNEKPKIRMYITDQRKYISKLKKDISGFKSLLR